MEADTERALVASIYSALLDPSRWQGFLSDAAAEVGGGARLQIHGWSEAGGGTCSVAAGYDPEMILAYRKLSFLNPWAQSIVRAPVGVPLRSERLCPEEVLKKTLFYADWVRPQEDIVAGAGMVVGRTPAGAFMFGGNIPVRYREIGQPRLIVLMKRLAPHLSLAWQIGQSMLASKVQLAAASASMTPAAAMILLRPDGTVAYADEAGERMLAEQALCGIHHGGCFSLRYPKAQEALSAALQNVQRGRGTPVAVTIPGFNGWPTIHLMEIDQSRCEDWPLATLLRLPERSLLCAVGPARPAKSTNLLAALGLTEAEQEVAAEIASGKDTALVAQRRGVSVTTVRSQVQSIYHKCGVRNRAALAALVLTARPIGGNIARTQDELK